MFVTNFVGVCVCVNIALNKKRAFNLPVSQLNWIGLTKYVICKVRGYHKDAMFCRRVI